MGSIANIKSWKISLMEGWIKLHRKISENIFWTCEPFTRGQAWVDLLLLASYQDSFFYVRGIKVDVKKGQLAWSESKLSERWGWSRTKLRKFLNDLEKEQQIIQQKDNVIQVITVVNYDEYQEKEPQTRQQKNRRKTAEKPIQEVKEYKEEYNRYLSESDDETYNAFIKYLLGDNEVKEPFENCLSLNDQISPENFKTLMSKYPKDLIKLKINAMENTKDLLKKYRSFYRTLNNWCQKG